MEELQDSLRQLDMENDAVVRPVLEKVADEIGELRVSRWRALVLAGPMLTLRRRRRQLGWRRRCRHTRTRHMS